MKFLVEIPDDIIEKWTERVLGTRVSPEEEILRRLSGGLNFTVDAKGRITVVEQVVEPDVELHPEEVVRDHLAEEQEKEQEGME